MTLKFTRNWIIGTLLFSVIIGVGIAKAWSKEPSANAEGDSVVADITTTESIIATVGDDTVKNGLSSQNSWAGSIISLGTVPVQPARDGSIISWMVKIGDSVYAGQPIAKLSEPPAMPELINMLATEAKMLAEKRAQSETTKQFVEKNNTQLKTQLAGLEQSSLSASALLSISASGGTSANARRSIEQAKDSVEAMRSEMRSFLDQMVSEHVNIITNTHTAALYRGGSISQSYGLLDQDARNVADVNLMQLIVALKNKESLPIDEAKKYLASGVRLAHSTVYSEGVEDIRKMMKDDQAEFLSMVSKYKEAEADISMQATEYENMNLEQKRMLVNDRKMIEEKIAENEKMVAMAKAEVAAAEASYATVLQGTKGGLYITAPLAGTVSTIEKNVGEFVGPGMPVARVTSRTVNATPFIRFRVPGNIRPPQVGVVVRVVRPGFPQDVMEARVIGAGLSLDSSGMYMADASFIKDTVWPIDASVRVIAPDSSVAISLPLSAIVWDVNGKPSIWAVSEVGRIYSKKITIGRTLGNSIEVYDGIKIGERYINKTTAEMKEDMLVEDVKKVESNQSVPAKSSEHDAMPGM